jgi:hypothetical protein
MRVSGLLSPLGGGATGSPSDQLGSPADAPGSRSTDRLFRSLPGFGLNDVFLSWPRGSSLGSGIAPESLRRNDARSRLRMWSQESG